MVNYTAEEDLWQDIQNSTADNICMKVYQLILSYTYVKPCDVILSPLFFALIHMPFIFSILWIEAAQVVMLMERAIAIYHVGNYETCGRKLGNSLFLLSVLIPLLEGAWAYADERFDNPEISCINTPVSRTTQVNTLFALSVVFHMVALITLSTMFCFHRKSSSSAQTLSSRFQSSENLTSSRLLITLSAIQLVVFFSYGGSIMYLRMTFNSNTDLPIYRSNILAAYLVPVYTFLLPLMTTIFLRSMKQTRKSEIRSMIEIKASGAEGWANYSRQLERQWNS
ncbi:unnamed protein product [Cylicocyclus nassatus]|uniref:Uncharacterized protein n=1 Tax=Cylicocyclus nassatus TaxID=53992 RepID=A0AA36MB48_CYLNA|nr:unnamed protein product [Cylicocyclus nassatus]